MKRLYLIDWAYLSWDPIWELIWFDNKWLKEGRRIDIKLKDYLMFLQKNNFYFLNKKNEN